MDAALAWVSAFNQTKVKIPPKYSMNGSAQELYVQDTLAIDSVGNPTTPTRPANSRSAFTRHVVMFSLANLCALVGNGILTFLLPRLLSMESYGYYRLFLLYGGFAGVLHLGLLDGTLIRWAARPRSRMKAELLSSLIFLLLLHLLLLTPVVAVLLTSFRHEPWFFLAVAIVLYALVWNTASMGQFALQAEKSFGWLSALTVLNPALLLASVLVIRHWGRLNLDVVLAAAVAAWLVAGLAIWAVLLSRHHGRFPGLLQVWRIGAYNVKIGCSVLLALLLTNIVLSLDRLVVSVSFSIRDFAIYSLAANALAVVNTIILSISRVVFPYLSDPAGSELKIRAYAQGEAMLMALWALGLAAYFPLRALIEWLLPDYVSSLPILRLLLLATGMTATIYILHANYFRSALQQGKLLLGVSIGLLAAALFLLIARRSGDLVNMAWAMLAAIAVWWIADEILLRELTRRGPLEIARTLFFTAACCASLLGAARVPNPWLAALAYCSVAAALTVISYRTNLKALPFSRQFYPTIPDFGSSE